MALAPETSNTQADMAQPPTQPATGMERRMNIRAFDYWESLLDGRDFPSVGDLDPEAIGPFREHSLLIDFTGGYEKPILRYVGSHLRAEASLANREIDPNDVPSGTLLSRLTNHYLEILANRAPIGFEAEYENESNERILYRGILLPLSDDGTTINFIYGVTSWKVEDILPGEETTSFDDDVLDLDAPVDPADEELLELTQALDEAETESLLSGEVPDDEDIDQDLQSLVSEIDAVLGNTGPAEEPVEESIAQASADPAPDEDGTVADLPVDAAPEPEEDNDLVDLDAYVDEPGEEAAAPSEDAGAPTALDEDEPLEDLPPISDEDMPPPERAPEPLAAATDDNVDPADEEFYDLLAKCQTSASDLARFDSRSRAALYDTLGLAYDFHLVSARRREAYQTLLEQTGITMQSRAPLTPIVKLVFGQGYDKTRLTEYAAALGYADREGVPQGDFQSFVDAFEGGIKAMVKAERAARNQARGNESIDKLEAAKAALRERQAMMTLPDDVVTGTGEEEFVLMVARRDPSGGYSVLDTVETGKSTLEAALKKAAARKKKTP
ncbi:MAG: hypothetical protein AAF221_10400 [Pseudomonadota bacterium]